MEVWTGLCIILEIAFKGLIRFLRLGSVEKFLHRGSVEMLPLRELLRFLHHGSVEKFRHCESVEMLHA